MIKLINNIGWCDATINGVTGCTKVSEGCANCYAETGTRARSLRSKGVETWGPSGKRIPVRFGRMFRSLARQSICNSCRYTSYERPGLPCPIDGCTGTLRRIRLFADSNSDWLDPAWPDEVLCAYLVNIITSSSMNIILLTKRPALFEQRLAAAARAAADPSAAEMIQGWLRGDTSHIKHIWVGVSAENQKRAEERIPLLMRIPCSTRFVSAEPLLGPIELKPWLPPARPSLQWVIVGMESGPNRRDGGLANLISLVNQVSSSGIPVWVKQDLGFFQGQQGRIPDEIWQLKQTP